MDEGDSVKTEKRQRKPVNMPDNSHKPATNPTVGVKSDFERLLTSFTETKTVRYEEFVKIWRSMQMSLIFSGRRTDQEAREFTEDCFNIALTFLMPPYNFQVRVGALYILYGLYWKQPCRPSARIRATADQWKELTGLMEEVKEQQHLDVEYVFTVLEYHRAFTFTATSIPMYPHMRDIVDDDTKLLKADAMAILAEQKSILSEILEPDNIDQLSAIHEQYHRLKCLLSGPNNTKPKGSLDVIKPSLVQYITKSVAAYEEKRKVITGRKARKRHDSRDSGQTTTSESEAESDIDNPGVSPSKRKKRQVIKKELTTGDRRAQIKAKAFAVDNTASLGRRHRKGNKDTSQSSDGFTSPSFSSPSPKAVKRSKSPKSPKKTKSKLTTLDEVSDISPWGSELRSNLLSMPIFEGTEPETKKRKSPKASTGKKSKGKTPVRKKSVTDDEAKTPTRKGSNKKSPHEKNIKEEFASPESVFSSDGGETSGKSSGRGKNKKTTIKTKGTKESSQDTSVDMSKSENELTTPQSNKKSTRRRSKKGIKTEKNSDIDESDNEVTPSAKKKKLADN